MKWIRWLAVATMFAVGVGAVFLSTTGFGDTATANAQVLTQAAVRTDVTKTSAATGTVTSEGSYALAFGKDARLVSDTSTGGTADSEWTVADVLVAVGDWVAAGQALATATTTDLEADLAVAEAELAIARMKQTEAQEALKDARSEAQRDLVDAKTAVTAAELSLRNARVQRNDAADGNPKRQARIAVIQAEDQLRASRQLRDDLREQLKGDFPVQQIAVGEAEAAVTTLETQIADLTDQLELASIVAPIDGIVSAVNVRPGFVAPADSAIEIDSTTLQVVADVVESDVSSLALGQTAMVTIDALDRDVAGVVTSIAPSTDAGTASVVTYPVTVTIQDPDAAIRPGMSSDVEITVAEAPSVVAVPAVALRGRQGDYAVDVAVGDGTTQRRQVQVGLVTETLAEIQSGISEGDAVVVGTTSERVTSGEEQGFPGGPGGFGGGLGGLQGGGGFRPGRLPGD